MRSRRILAFLLAFMMVITMIPQSTLNAKSKKKQKINNLPSKTGIAAQKEYAKFIAIARAKKEKKGKK